MSKLSKILVLILCLTLVVGGLAMFASAADEPTRVSLPKGTSDYQNVDFEYSAVRGDTINVASSSKLEIGMANRTGYLASARNGDNVYIRFFNYKGEFYTGANPQPASPYVGVYFGGYGSTAAADWSIANFKYITQDLDICADQYIDANGKFTDNPDEAVDISYNNDMNLHLIIRGHSGTAQAQKNTILKIVKEDGIWYLKYTPTGDRVALSQEVDVWNHLTFVFETGQEPIMKGLKQVGWKFSESKLHVYLDGNHFITIENCISEAANSAGPIEGSNGIYSEVGLDQLRFEFNRNQMTSQDVSVAIDNINTNYYQNGYTGGLDEVVADPSKSVCDAYDTVLANGYKMPYPNKSVASVDGVEHYFQASALKAMTNNSVIELYRDFTSDYYVHFPFMVKSNGYEFNYWTASYEQQQVGDDIYFVEATDPVCVVFDGDPNNSQYKGDLYDDSLTLRAGAVIEYPHEVAQYRYDDELGCMLEFLGWNTDPNATTALASLPTITQDDVYYGTYYLFPVYREVACAYFTTKGEETVGYVDFEGFLEALATDGVTVTLNKALTGEELTGVISIENNAKIDTQGYAFKYYSETKVADVEGTVYTFRDVTDADKADVNWLDLNGDIVYTEKHTVGNTITRPQIENVIETNVNESLSTNLYLVYMDWETSLTVAEENMIYPTNERDADIIINITEVKYNVSAFSYFDVNVYVPAPENNKVRVINAGAKEVTIGGEDYVMIPAITKVNANNISRVTVTVDLQINGKKQSQSFEISLPEYFASVLEQQLPGAEDALILTAIHYCNEAYKLCNEGDSYEAYDQILTLYEFEDEFLPYLNEMVDESIAYDIEWQDSSGISKFVSGATLYYSVDDFRPSIAFAVNTGVTHTGGIYNPASGSHEQVGDNQFIIEGFGIDKYDEDMTQTTDMLGCELVTVVNDDMTESHYLVFDSSFSNICNVTDIFVCFVQYKEPSKNAKEAGNMIYNLGMYINSVEEAGGDATLGRAIYALSLIADMYNEEAGKDDNIFIKVID